MTCAKARVTATLATPDGWLVEGANDCAAPQAVCPRVGAAYARDDYSLCATVCRQAGHAEMVALAQADAAGLYVRGGVMRVGHWRVCPDCAAAMVARGVTWVCEGVER